MMMCHASCTIIFIFLWGTCDICDFFQKIKNEKNGKINIFQKIHISGKIHISSVTPRFPK